jgi:hypothetical protein
MDEIVTRTTVVRLEASGIVRVTALPGSVQGLAEAEENMRAFMQLAGGRAHPMLLDIRQMKSQDREARLYYAESESAQLISAVAIIIGSPISRVLGNFVLGFSKADAPTKIFTSEHEAVAWLREFV